MTDGQVDIEGEIHEVPEGVIVRIGPDPIRRLCNDTDETHVWILFGARRSVPSRTSASM